MKSPLKAFSFALFIFGACIAGSSNSFSQDKGPSDEQYRDDQTQQTLDQIHDLEAKIQENSKHLDAVAESLNELDAKVVSQQEVPVQAPAPVQLAYAVNTPYASPAATSNDGTSSVHPQAYIAHDQISNIPKENTFELSQQNYYSTFKQPGLYKRVGALFGFNVGYTYHGDVQSMPINVFHSDISGAYGSLGYNYQGDKIKKVDNWAAEPRAWVGKDLTLSPNTTLTPYIGLGYRWYFDRLKLKTDANGDGGANVVTQYVYIPVGFQISLHPTNGWRIDVTSEYDALAWGKFYSNDSGREEDSGGIRFDRFDSTLKGFGLRDSIKFVKEGRVLNFFIEPFVRYWNVKTTDNVTIINGGLERFTQRSRNITTELGARLGIEF